MLENEHVHIQQIRHAHRESVHGRAPVPPRGEPILVCKGLHYSYLDRFVALNGVDLSVHRGEKLALLGANGCGKSTLLKILDGLIFPSSGTVTAYGEPVTEDSLEDEQMNAGFRSRVGFVFQNSDAQVFSPTVRDELSFGPLQLGMERNEILARIDDVLALLEITDLADRAPFQLSGGQKKRVAIGTVLATHDLDSLERLADRCVVFSEEHQIVAEGTPAEVLARRELLLEVNLIHQHTQLPVPVYGAEVASE